MKHDTKAVTRVEHKVHVTEADILQWLSKREGARNARITIETPTGGDCSGQTLDLDECGGLTVTWTEEVVEDS